MIAPHPIAQAKQRIIATTSLLLLTEILPELASHTSAQGLALPVSEREALGEAFLHGSPRVFRRHRRLVALPEHLPVILLFVRQGLEEDVVAVLVSEDQVGDRTHVRSQNDVVVIVGVERGDVGRVRSRLQDIDIGELRARGHLLPYLREAWSHRLRHGIAKYEVGRGRGDKKQYKS